MIYRYSTYEDCGEPEMNLIGTLCVLVSLFPMTTSPNAGNRKSPTPSESGAIIRLSIDLESNNNVIDKILLDYALSTQTVYANSNGITVDYDIIEVEFKDTMLSGDHKFTTGVKNIVFVWDIAANPESVSEINAAYQVQVYGSTQLPNITASSSGTVKDAHQEGECTGVLEDYFLVNPGGMKTGTIQRTYITVIIQGEEVEIPIYKTQLYGNANLYDEG
jgi:hypothetical protein